MEVHEMLGMIISNIITDYTEGSVKTIDNRHFTLNHEQDCCEDVYLTDICGDLNDICNSPLLQAEEIIQENGPNSDDRVESETWTFYKFATIKGRVTFRWYGESNGYYSETVSFREV